MLIFAIRGDYGRPTHHARNLFHTSIVMYDAWAAYDSIAKPYLLGNTVGNFTCPFNGIAPSANVAASRDTAISYAAYRLLRHRFAFSPGNTNPNFFTSQQLDFKMLQRGYDISFTSTDYSTGSAAALGNYIASQMIGFGYQDGAREQFGYSNAYYLPVNPPLVTNFAGNPDLVNANRWQQLSLDLAIDQNGVPFPSNTPGALSPEWGNLVPFAMDDDDKVTYQRNGHDWNVYHDPGAPPQLVPGDSAASAEYIWNFALVVAWCSHLEPDDNAILDISPASIGNLAVENMPTTFEEYKTFYKLEDGGVNFSNGHAVNPATGQPYTPQYVSRGDYARVLAEFWADGPNSDTPPGHWFEIINYVMDHPQFSRKYRGQGEPLDPLEFDVKAYLMLGGALHDAAITAWSTKGYYDGIRPISAIRYMAEHGQSSDPSLPNYDPMGLPLIPGIIEVVQPNDPIIGKSYGRTPNNMIVSVGDIKVLSWNGPDSVIVSATDEGGVGWIPAKYWWPYQRPTFVTPPFPGYISGHSTYSRTAAEVLTALTGDAFFPGGMGEFTCPQNQFLVFEDGPAQTVTLQWATYRDASDQCSLSRIWGGIHPPVDDIPGRKAGILIASDAVAHAETYFFVDEDQDGYYNYLDCDDTNAAIYPNNPEVCDGLDNDCNGVAEDGLQFYTYYEDLDGDGFGSTANSVSSCATTAPTGFVDNLTDCNDLDIAINANATEACDEIDNDCNGMIDDGLQQYTYYQDADGDSFGFGANSQTTCDNTAPLGYVNNFFDCDDTNAAININATEVCDEVDNNCDGATDEGLPVFTYYQDSDGDGFGDADASQASCFTTPPANYSTNNTDCDDNNAAINPDAIDVALDGIDNNCDGLLDAVKDLVQKNWKLSPNPTTGELNIQYDFGGQLNVQVFSASGALQLAKVLDFKGGAAKLGLTTLPKGVYMVVGTDAQGTQHFTERVVKI